MTSQIIKNSWTKYVPIILGLNEDTYGVDPETQLANYQALVAVDKNLRPVGAAVFILYLVSIVYIESYARFTNNFFHPIIREANVNEAH